MLKEILGGNVCPVCPKHRTVYPIPNKLGFLFQVFIRRKLQKGRKIYLPLFPVVLFNVSPFQSLHLAALCPIRMGKYGFKGTKHLTIDN